MEKNDAAHGCCQRRHRSPSSRSLARSFPLSLPFMRLVYDGRRRRQHICKEMAAFLSPFLLPPLPLQSVWLPISLALTGTASLLPFIHRRSRRARCTDHVAPGRLRTVYVSPARPKCALYLINYLLECMQNAEKHFKPSYQHPLSLFAAPFLPFLGVPEGGRIWDSEN